MIYAGERKEGYLKVATAAKPRGLKGHLKVIPHADNPDRFYDLSGLYVWRDGAFFRMELAQVQVQGAEVFVKFAGVDDRDAAEALRGVDFYVPPEDAPSLDEGAYFIVDLVGCRVADAQKTYGVLTGVMQAGAADVYMVRRDDGGTQMFPALKRVLRRVDIVNRRIDVDAAALEEVAVYED
ncbi:MAG: ribosome maturation factor RimM [Eubacteriales bacterium]|nr:ribosome maturation factor RimM [Eubacteriales bacterium]